MRYEIYTSGVMSYGQNLRDPVNRDAKHYQNTSGDWTCSALVQDRFRRTVIAPKQRKRGFWRMVLLK